MYLVRGAYVCHLLTLCITAGSDWLCYCYTHYFPENVRLFLCKHKLYAQHSFLRSTCVSVIYFTLTSLQDPSMGRLSYHKYRHFHISLSGKLWVTLSGGLFWSAHYHHVWYVWLDGESSFPVSLCVHTFLCIMIVVGFMYNIYPNTVIL